mmetsp:Transcript_24259/g.51461  ORF Transcript_24259/g.51461 Transcript_24259/m.51461 type:complete len:185 (-) Transcript_24259:517-1071(-)
MGKTTATTLSKKASAKQPAASAKRTAKAKLTKAPAKSKKAPIKTTSSGGGGGGGIANKKKASATAKKTVVKNEKKKKAAPPPPPLPPPPSLESFLGVGSRLGGSSLDALPLPILSWGGGLDFSCGGGRGLLAVCPFSLPPPRSGPGSLDLLGRRDASESDRDRLPAPSLLAVTGRFRSSSSSSA